MTGIVFRLDDDFGWGYRMHYGPAAEFGRADRKFLRLMGWPFQSREEALLAMERNWLTMRTEAENAAAQVQRLNEAFGSSIPRKKRNSAVSVKSGEAFLAREFYPFKVGNSAFRIKSGETFQVKITIPERDCPCGCKWGELDVVKMTYSDNTVSHHFFCPKCGREGPRTDAAFEAGLAWGGMISREKQKGDSGVRDV
jgi:hypothetical protein